MFGHLQNSAIHRHVIVPGGNDQVRPPNQALFVNLLVVNECAPGSLATTNNFEVVGPRNHAYMLGYTGRSCIIGLGVRELSRLEMASVTIELRCLEMKFRDSGIQRSMRLAPDSSLPDSSGRPPPMPVGENAA